jgi:hypothetical protein
MIVNVSAFPYNAGRMTGIFVCGNDKTAITAILSPGEKPIAEISG